MSSRFVLLYPDNQFNRGTVTSGHLLLARVAARTRAATGGMATAGSAALSGRVVAAIPRAGGISDSDLNDAESSGPPLTSLNVVKRLPDDDGPVLIECSDEDRLAMQREYPGARLVPEGTAHMAMMALVLQEVAEMAGVGSKPPAKLRVKVVDAKKSPLARIQVQAVFDRKAKPPLGATTITNEKGFATILVPARFKTVDVVVEPNHSFWPAAKVKVKLTKGTTSVQVVCPNILGADDCARALYAEGPADAGKGVVVAVIDGGAGPHTAIAVDGGTNLADDNKPNDISDNGIGHGTHVAGLIAGKSTRKFRGGFAPGVTLRIYRVFPEKEKSCGSFDVAAAIRQAVDDGADIINMSLTLPSDQPEVTREMRRARASGVSIIAAAGNDGGPVMFPARFSGILAVSAMGIVGCAPKESSIDLVFRKKPLGTDPNHRIAEFSCFGSEIDLIGPGAGVVSCFPGGKRAVMSGTSMATPVVTGRIARALAANNEMLNRPRDQKRSDAINRMALRAVKTLGFETSFQGQGLPE